MNGNALGEGSLYYSVDLGKFVINVVEVNVYRDSFKRAWGHSEDDCSDPRFAYRRINILFYIGTEGVQGIGNTEISKLQSYFTFSAGSTLGETVCEKGEGNIKGKMPY